jgi:hypothetical protein
MDSSFSSSGNEECKQPGVEFDIKSKISSYFEIFDTDF